MYLSWVDSWALDLMLSWEALSFELECIWQPWLRTTVNLERCWKGYLRRKVDLVLYWFFPSDPNRSCVHGHYPSDLRKLSPECMLLPTNTLSFMSHPLSLPYFLLPPHSYSVQRNVKLSDWGVNEWQQTWVEECLIRPLWRIGCLEQWKLWVPLGKRWLGCLPEEKGKAFLWRT